jgi:hypothetical protein
MKKMTRTAKQPESEWSYSISVDDIPTQGKSYEIAPDDAEREAIARRLGIESLNALRARLRVSREERGYVFQVQGELSADVTQSCVITLEPVDSKIEDSFEAWYADHGQALSFKRAQHDAQSKKDTGDLPILEEHEDPEPIENGRIDLGELVIQYLSLSINPYPQKEGVDYENKEMERKSGTREALRPNPFAALKNWRPKD